MDQRIRSLVAASAASLVLLAATPCLAQPIQLNELRIDKPNSAEYAELRGPANASLDGLTFLVIGDGSGGSGTIEEVTNLDGHALGGDGLFLIAEDNDTLGAAADLITNLNFENSDNVTMLLVDGFTGALNNDLDTNNDGTLDVLPWTSVVDAVGLVESPNPPSGTEYSYGASLGFEDVGPNTRDGNKVPNHVYRCLPGGGWRIGAKDAEDDDSVDTPGAANAPCPSNDDCIDASEIGPGFTSFDTSMATTDGPDHGDCFDGDDEIHNDIWFKYTAGCSEEVQINTCGNASFDTRLAIYAGTACTGLEDRLLACNDDAAGCGATSSLAVDLDEGQTYLIRVGGATADESGTGMLQVSASSLVLSAETAVPDAEFEPGDPVFIEVRMSGLCGQQVTGFQAFLQFDCEQIEFVGGMYTDEPFGQHILAPITANGTQIDLAAGINQIANQPPATEDALLAVLEFTSLIPVADPDVMFRPHQPPTRLSDPFGNEITPILLGATCPADTNHDGTVDVDDLILVILSWGQSLCAADVNGDNIVDVDDLVAVILAWGDCP